MYIAFDQVSVSTTVLTVANLTFTPPVEATHVELQADTGNVRYTMVGTTAPSTSSGMLILKDADHPKLFSIADFKRIRMVRDGSNDAKLNIHYIGRE